MIKTTQHLWRRSIEIARQMPPEQFDRYPHLSDLRLGWYPSAAFFRPEAEEIFHKALPDTTGVVFPYHHDWGTLSHLAVIPYEEDGSLNHKRRVAVPAKGSRTTRLSGIFGIHRLKVRQPSIVVTDDELLVCRFSNAIAVSYPHPRVAHIIKRSTSVVNLKSNNPRWIHQMLALAKHGLQVSVNDRPLVDHVADLLVQMLHERVGLSIVTDRVQGILGNLVPLERVAVIQLVKQATSVNLEEILPSEFKIYAREAEFYESVQRELGKLVLDTWLDSTGVWIELDLADGRRFTVPFNKLSVGAAVCEAAGIELDLVDWARRDLKELPHFYLYRGKDQMETRAGICDRIAEVVMTILVRQMTAKAAKGEA